MLYRGAFMAKTAGLDLIAWNRCTGQCTACLAKYSTTKLSSTTVAMHNRLNLKAPSWPWLRPAYALLWWRQGDKKGTIVL